MSKDGERGEVEIKEAARVAKTIALILREMGALQKILSKGVT